MAFYKTCRPWSRLLLFAAQSRRPKIKADPGSQYAGMFVENHKSWLSYAPGCFNHETVELHGKIYVVGGVLGSNSQEQTMECYDHVTESWSSLSPPRQKRYTHCAVSLDEYIYVIGGNELRKYQSTLIEIATTSLKGYSFCTLPEVYANELLT